MTRAVIRFVVDGWRQLGLDGGEVPSAQARATSSRAVGLSTAQQGILEVIRRQGYIRPVEAGVIVHRGRNDRCSRKVNEPSATGDRWKGGGKGCCAFASTDGSSALKRLAKRGLVKRQQGGKAVPVEPTGPLMCGCGNKAPHPWEPGEWCPPELVAP